MQLDILDTEAFETDFPLSPRQNHLLAALPTEEYERLLPALKLVALSPGACLHAAGDRDTHLYFPVSGIVARSHLLEDGAQASVSLVGNDGAVGLSILLSDDPTPSRAVVMSAGHAYRLRAGVVKAAFAQSGGLAGLLLRYTLTIVTQVAQISVCNRFHTVDQQMCRLLLSCLDRLQSSKLITTHALLADTLGVRREGISEAAGRLRAAGLIRNSRNRIIVLDRAGVEARACECYAAVKRECERLLPPEEATAASARRYGRLRRGTRRPARPRSSSPAPQRSSGAALSAGCP